MLNEKLLDHTEAAEMLLDDAVDLIDTNDQGKAETADRLLRIAQIHILLAIRHQLFELNQRPY